MYNIRMSREFDHHIWGQVNPCVSWYAVKYDWHGARIRYLSMNRPKVKVINRSKVKVINRSKVKVINRSKFKEQNSYQHLPMNE